MSTSDQQHAAPGARRTPNRRRSRLLAATALTSLGLLAGVTAPAQAATTSLYAAPAVAGTGDCGSPTNACDIATAVTTANAASVADDVRIALAPGAYPLSAPAPTALAITFAGPSLTIDVPSGTATLDGTDTVRVLSVGTTSNVTVDGVDFTSGATTATGGAIQNGGTLTVRDATFSGNAAGNGGAIANSAGATLTVRDSTFSHNTATSVGGGAIINFGAATILRSALLHNTAPINGGAVNVQPGAAVTISNSTLAGNTSGSLGGAMSNLGTLDVQASTISGNSASSGSAIATGNTGVTFAADIIAAQAAGDACNPTGTAVVDGGYNLDTDGTCISATSPATGSHNGTTAYGTSTYGDALAAYLADQPGDNGGPTQSIALLNSPDPATTLANPAFDVIPADFALPTAIGGVSAACSLPDQRGVLPLAGARCAIGAYLLQATETTVAASSATVVEKDAVTYTATVAPAADGGTMAFDDGAGNPATTQCAAQPVSGGKATCTVSYAASGTYSVTATYSGDGPGNDFAGSAASPAQTITVVPPPPPTPPAPPTPPSPPNPPAPPVPTLKLSNLTVTRCLGTAKGARKTGTVGYTVSAASTVTFTLQRRVKPPNGVRSTCPAALPAGVPGDYVDVRGAGAPRTTTRAVATAAGSAAKTHVLTSTVAVGAGSHTFSLKTLVGSTVLKPGRYRVLVQAVGTAGAKAQNAAYLWVLQPKRKA